MAERKYEKYVVTELKTPAQMTEAASEYAKRATRVLWLDEDVVPGAFHVNVVWYWKATDAPATTAHKHEHDEVIGFFGSDPDNPTDLGGEVEFWLEDEAYTLNKSTMIFAPAGMTHCPLWVKRIDRPIFHFTIVPNAQYVREG